MQTEAQLAKLPPAPASDPSFELFRRLRDLINAIGAAVEGSDDAEFYRAADESYSVFRAAVLKARPTVRLTSSSSEAAVPGSSVTGLREEDPQFWLQGPAHEGKGEPEGLITLDNVRRLAARYRVRELPSFPPYRVLEELVQGLKGRWDVAALACLHSVSEALTQLADRVVQEHFGQFAAARREVRCVRWSGLGTL